MGQRRSCFIFQELTCRRKFIELTLNVVVGRSMSQIGVRSFFGVFRAKQKTCEACAMQFECGSLAKPCWCRKVKLSSDALAELTSRYTDCLCPDCLNEVARKDELRRSR